MELLVWLIVVAPFAGSLLLMLLGSSIPKKLAGAIGCASVGLSCILAMSVLTALLREPSSPIVSTSWQWMSVGGLNIQMGLRVTRCRL